jgi:methyltransferase (TIGR00027 family)
MRETTPSRTAAWVAACRSYGAALPDEARLIDDPYGLPFATGSGMPGVAPPAAAVRLPTPLRSWVLYMQVRTRVLDDVLLDFVAGGGRQVVLLGAGYDARALRFAGELVGARVFEVDHPATQGHKRRVLARRRLDDRAAAVRFVTWDFEARPMRELAGALAVAGHDAAAPTLTIWEGVTMYLTEGAIDASVRAVRGWSAPRSQLAITYVTRDAIERPSLPVRATRVLLRGAGEPWRFGWDPGALPGWLASRGFDLHRDATIAAEAARLLPARYARGVGTLGQRYALAQMTESIAVAGA